MMTGRHGGRLDTWIAAVRADGLPHLHTFANCLERDRAAVLNGLTLAYSSGAVERNVCRVKAIKRSRYGRAKLDLLRKIILCPGQTNITISDGTTQNRQIHLPPKVTATPGRQRHRIMAGYLVHRRAKASTAMVLAGNVHTSTRSPVRPVSAATAS
jgi:Transposase